MQLSSSLPLSYMAFAHWHTDDTEVGIVVAKAAFRLSADGTLPVKPAPDLVLVDEFQAEPADSPLIHDQDIAPFKPKTDLILRGTARSFEGRPRRDWAVSVRVADMMSYGFHVRGPANWRKHKGRWQLEQPDAVTQVPLSYALAYGGKCEQGDAVSYFEQNPSGQGFMTEAAAYNLENWSAPQIGLLAEFMAARPFTPMAVHGFGPIAKAWLPRRGHAGTFDANWEHDRHPRMPLDYDLAFWNAAHRRMQLAPYLKGDEKIEIAGVSDKREVVHMRLPGAKLALQSHVTDAVTPMALDTVDIDIDTIDDGFATMSLLWRALLPDRAAYEKAEIIRG